MEYFFLVLDNSLMSTSSKDAPWNTSEAAPGQLPKSLSSLKTAKEIEHQLSKGQLLNILIGGSYDNECYA